MRKYRLTFEDNSNKIITGKTLADAADKAKINLLNLSKWEEITDKTRLKCDVIRDRDGIWLRLWYNHQQKHSYPIKDKMDLITIVKAISIYIIE